MLAAAPLAVGGVHRVPMILLMLGSAVGLACVAFGTMAERRQLRIGIGVVAPSALLIIPVIQSIPLPLSLRGVLDPNGNALLLNNALVPISHWPLSLDPPVTRERIGQAAAALAMFVVAYHLASGKSRRHLVTHLVAITAVLAVAVGLGHKVFGFSEIYGLVNTTERSLLTGPFVNPNHTAEFLELGVFACLACAFQRNTALNRYGWLMATCVCAAGALATISRGAFLGLFAGAVMFIFLRYLSRRGRSERTRPTAVAWGIFVSLLVLGIAGALGAGALVDRFRTTAVNEDLRLQVWLDSLHVLRAHPLGIGRGAFQRVYPAYRTFKTVLPLTFEYVENQPLQLLLDAGWPLFALALASAIVVLRTIVVRRRGDEIEAALLGGLFAVSVHAFVDFGLETLGVLLPFVALLGTVLGRDRASDSPPTPGRIALPFVAVACAGLVFGAAALAHKSSDDFDKLLRFAGPGEPRRTVLVRAQEAHPTDYFYALAYAGTEPLKAGADGKSPRLHALNRALRLCPNCELTHVAIARSLWQLGRRSQSLSEWRTAVQLRSGMFHDVVIELWRAGANAQQLASVAAFDPATMLEVVTFLSAQARIDDAIVVLDQADAIGAPHAESLLARARLQLQAHEVAAAETTLAQLRATGFQDPRLALLEADTVLEVKGPRGADEAFAILDTAATRYPLDISVQRRRLAVVTTYSKWQATDRALDGFKRALYATEGGATEAYLASARIHVHLSEWRAAMIDYRTALSQDSSDVGLWLEYGQAAENAGRDSTAHDAYVEAARLSPANATAANALARLEARRQNQLKSALMGAESEVDSRGP